MAGTVFSGERKLAKPGDMLANDAPLEVRGKDHPWVSRGGIKLAHGLDHFIKPQFEAGREEVGKGGVIRDPQVHERVCAAAAEWVGSQGWRVLGIAESPIRGPEGNVEFLLGAVKD